MALVLSRRVGGAVGTSGFDGLVFATALLSGHRRGYHSQTIGSTLRGIETGAELYCSARSPCSSGGCARVAEAKGSQVLGMVRLSWLALQWEVFARDLGDGSSINRNHCSR